MENLQSQVISDAEKSSDAELTPLIQQTESNPQISHILATNTIFQFTRAVILTDKQIAAQKMVESEPSTENIQHLNSVNRVLERIYQQAPYLRPRTEKNQ